MATSDVTDATFKQTLDSNDNVIVMFGAPWCRPCTSLKPTLEHIKSKFESKIAVVYINCDENQDTPEECRIMAIPTVLFFKKSKEVDRFVGIRSEKTYLEKIAEIFDIKE